MMMIENKFWKRKHILDFLKDYRVEVPVEHGDFGMYVFNKTIETIFRAFADVFDFQWVQPSCFEYMPVIDGEIFRKCVLKIDTLHVGVECSVFKRNERLKMSVYQVYVHHENQPMWPVEMSEYQEMTDDIQNI